MSSGKGLEPQANLDLTLSQDEVNLVTKVLDIEWYLGREVALQKDDIDPVAHFALIGWREGRSPCSDFDLAAALEVDESAGLEAYIAAGTMAGVAASKVITTSGKAPHNVYDKRVVGQFDSDFYVASYGNDLGREQDPLTYFMTAGWKKGHNPSPDFDTNFYIETYSDIKKAGLNPFEHYVLFGKAEGRAARPDQAKRMKRNLMASSAPKHLAHLMTLPREQGVRAAPGAIDFEAMDIHWIVPDFARGGGGHMTIFRTIRHLEMMGHTCTIWIERRDFHVSADEAYDDIVKHFQCVGAKVRFVSPALYHATGDIVVATGWTTAYVAAACSGFKERFYFVQDHEPSFYAMGTDALLARGSYDLDLACVCASPWLQKILSERYGRWSRGFHLAYDSDVYSRDGKTTRLGAEDGTIRVCLYARDHTPRRAIGLALMALDEMGRRGLPIEVHFFGQDDLPFDEVPYDAVNHGILSSEELAILYRSCDLGICFSATNYSLIPQEMMACGLPVVELEGDSTQAIFPEGVVTLAGPNPFDIADKVEAFVLDRAKREDQAQRAFDWVGQFDWRSSAEHVAAAFKERLKELGATEDTAAAQIRRATRQVEDVVDVVIPTWNGMHELKPVIEALRNQTGRVRPNIICVDSSSSDGTAEWLAEQSDITLKVIPQAEFQHGRTRNLGASLGASSLICFLTQDAIPAHSGWLHDIWTMMTHFPDAAGLYGRHIAYPQHSVLTHHELDAHFAQFLNYPLKTSKKLSGRVWGHDEERWQQILHFYSDNNSCMRRSVWETLPYPEVDYGEDQVWAHEMIEAGYAKVYAPTATVIHSHDYGPEETYKRCKTEADFFLTHFGYVIAPTSASAVESAIEREQMNKAKWLSANGADDAEIAAYKRVVAEKYRGYADGIQAARARKKADT